MIHREIVVGTQEANMGTTVYRRALLLVAFWMGVDWSGLAQAESSSFKVPMTGASCVPPVETNGTATVELTYDAASRVVTWRITYDALSSPATMAHFHGPAAQGKNGPVVIWLTPQGSPPGNPITGQATLTSEQAQQFIAGDWYVNVHTQSHPACELRGQVMPPKS
jgi:YD repeat-containing protein